MTADDHRSTTLPDVYPRETRTLQVTPHPYFTPDNAIVAAVYRDRATGEPSYYPVEVKRSDLLAALDAYPNPAPEKEAPEMTIQITGATETEPDGTIVLHAEADGREVSFGPFDRRSLLAALRAEPDETDYQEVLAENHSLGKRLAKTVRERDSWKSRAEDAERERDEARAEEPEEGLYSPRDDQAQIDRSWALEKAGEVLGRLAAVGVHLSDSEAALKWAAEWILDVDRG